MRFLSFIFIFFLFGCAEGNRSATVPRLPIRIALQKPVATVVGHVWPKSGGANSEFTTSESPSSVTVEFPSGRTWMTDSKISFFSQDENVVSSAKVTPLDTSTTFTNAVAHVRKTTEELGVAADTRVIDRLGEWQTKPPSWDEFSAKSLGCEIEPGIKLFAEIKPANENGKWFVSYDFTVQKFFVSESGATELRQELQDQK